MEFVAMIMVLVVLATTLPISSSMSNRTGFIFPLLHRNHPEVVRQFGGVVQQPLEVSPIKKRLDQSLYYVNFLVGSEAESVFAVFDTGSGFTWLQTNKLTSSTYRPLSCDDDACSQAPGHNCQQPSAQCLFKTRYPKFVSGRVGIDTFHFFQPTDDGGHNPDPSTTIRTDVVFGTTDDKIMYSGVMGVTGQPLGILNRLEVILFSYCFPKSDQQASYVRFGTDALIAGETTPLVPVHDDQFAFGFDVSSITVQGSELTKLTRDAGRRGGTFIFDTGAALTDLHPVAMDAVVDRVRKSIRATPTRQRPGGYELCYRSADRAAISGLEFKFNFNGGGSIGVDFDNLWVGYGKFYCLAFRRSTSDQSIYGARQMRGWGFGMDLHDKLLYFNYEDDCSDVL